MGLQDDHLPITHNELPYIEFDGERRVLGCLESELVCGLPIFGDVHGILPRSQWLEIDFEHYGVPTLNQANTSSCSGHATCNAAEYTWVQSGRELVRFNPFFIYALINHGVDRGASISDTLKAIEQYGICEKDQMPPGAMFQYQIPQAAFQNAKRYKVVKAFQCQTFDEIGTAITKGFPVVLGIYVGQNFPQVDNELVCPMPNGRGGGHALCGMGLKNSRRYGPVVKIHNSWGQQFGQNGFAYIHEGHFASRVDAYAMQVMAEDPQKPDDEPPIAKAAADTVKSEAVVEVKEIKKAKKKEKNNG